MDGSSGPLVLVFSSGSQSIPDKVVAEMNKEFDGVAYIMKTGFDAYFFSIPGFRGCRPAYFQSLLHATKGFAVAGLGV